VGRLLLVIVVVLVLALVLGGTGALDDAANIIVQILQVIFNVLVRLIDLFVELLKSLG
jgi:cell shape-determining protein MreC